MNQQARKLELKEFRPDFAVQPFSLIRGGNGNYTIHSQKVVTLSNFQDIPLSLVKVYELCDDT